MIIWLASYPKSGNTYIRSFLSAYYFSDDGNFEFKHLKNIDQYPHKKFFDREIRSANDASKNWISSQKKINKNNKNFMFKTHSALVNFNNNAFTNSNNTLGIIYIVRDPRNVITSIKNHYSMNYKEALNMMLNKKEYLFDKTKKKDFSNFTFLGSWSDHYKSWIKPQTYNRLIIKFEDLENNKTKTLKRLIFFINQISGIKKIDENKLNNAIKTTDVEKLKEREKLEGFPEAISSKERKEKLVFFNLGFANKWEKILPEDIKMRLNGELKEDLKFWKYNKN